MNKTSLNNRLVVEAYKTDKSLRANVSNGFATIAQKTGLVGLKVLMDAALVGYGNEGEHVKAGSTAYIREEILHNAVWAKAPLTCDTIDVPFMVVDLNFVEFVIEPSEPAA